MFKTMNVNWIVNYCQFLEIFLIQKYASLQKYIKIKDLFLRQLVSIGCQFLSIQGLSFVLAQMNATSCISGQNKKDSFLLGFGILHAVGGVRRFKV